MIKLREMIQMADNDKIVAEKKEENRYYKWLASMIIPVLAVITGLLVGAIFMLAIGRDPVQAYIVLFNSAFGSLNGFAETLVNTTPLIFTGLAVAFAFRTGLFNIGGDGQFLIGYIASTWLGFFFQLPLFIHLPLALLGGMVAAGLWGGFAGLLKAKLGVHEVITTIMMNYIALYLVSYLTGGPLKASGFMPATPKIADTAKLMRLLPFGRLNAGFIVALVAAYIVYYILWRTTLGYEIRAVGLNPDAAEYGGIKAARNMILAMFISGCLAGLAGVTQSLGLEFRAYQPFGFIGYGFTGIAVALLGKNHPAGVVLGAFLFGILQRGSMLMQSIAGVPKEVIEIIQAIIILFVAAEYLFTLLSNRIKKYRKETSDVN